MLKRLFYCFVALLIASVSLYLSIGHALPNQTLPAIVGSDTLLASGSPHEFFADEGTGNGLITEITDEKAYWLYVFGIDVNNVTGPPGRKVRFNLEDQAEGSSLKSLGISFALEQTGVGGNHRLECYQDFGFDGSSGQNLTNDKLIGPETTFDLRFKFTKAIETGLRWRVSPYYRLAGGSWTLFFDGEFTGSVPFDFLGAKLVVRFEAPLNGTIGGSISFDNFFVIGPPTGPLTEAFVDDNWVGLDLLDAVQFPGQNNIQIMGYDAFATIQEGINAFQGSPSPNYSTRNSQLSVILANEVNIAAGVYHENLILDDHINLTGAGSGADSTIATIIKASKTDMPVITINSITASGSSINNRLELRDLRVSGATGSSTFGSGILIIEGGLPPIPPLQTNQINSNVANKLSQGITQHILFDSVAAVNNQGSGINMVQPRIVEDIVLTNCILSDNLDSGLRFTDEPANFDGLTITGGLIENNGINGVTNGSQTAPIVKFGNQNSQNSIIANSQNQTLIASTLTNVHINGTTFSGNGGPNASLNSGDISINYLTGDASFTNVTITGDSAHVGLAIHGYNIGPPLPAGNISLDGVTIKGKYQFPTLNGIKTIKSLGTSLTDVGAGLFISDFSDARAISFSNVQIDVSPVDQKSDVVNLITDNTDSTLDIGNTTLGENADLSILNLAKGDMDATSATFTNAADNFAIEDRVTHIIDLDGVGLVRWTPKNVYVTRNSYVAPDTAASILRVIDAASAGDTVNVAAGNFWIWRDPQIYINKNLTLIGSGKNNTTIRANYDTGDTDDSKGWFLIASPAELNVRDITFDGTNYQIYQAFRLNGHGSFTNVGFNEIKVNLGGPPDYEGIAIVAHGDGAVDVTNCTFTEIGRVGVRYTGSAVTGSMFSGNTYTGKGQGDFLDYAVDIGGGASVEVANSTISGNRGTSGPDSSAGILISTTDGPGTIANISGSEIFDCTSAIQVGSSASDGSFVVATQDTLHDNDYGVSTSSALFVKIEKSDIYQNDIGINLNSVTIFFDIDGNDIYNNVNGVNLTNSFGEMDNNTIHGNTANGLTIFDVPSAATTVNSNEFCSNGILGINNQALSATVDATGNWWGASDGPRNPGGGSGDSVSVGVNFSPFETSSLFPDSPCPEPVVLVETKIFLEGPYNSSTDMMSTALNNGGNIPLTSPYTEDPRTVVRIPQNVVDWVLVELRSTQNGSAVGSKSAFLHKDGRVVADDGTTGQISFNLLTEGEYYIVIRHRNHLSIMSAAAVALSSSSSTLYDFTTGPDKFFASDAKKLETGVYGMYTGDANGNDQVQNDDKNDFWRIEVGTGGYKSADFNLNGEVQNDDKNDFWRTNVGRGTQVPPEI